MLVAKKTPDIVGLFLFIAIVVNTYPYTCMPIAFTLINFILNEKIVQIFGYEN